MDNMKKKKKKMEATPKVKNQREKNMGTKVEAGIV